MSRYPVGKGSHCRWGLLSFIGLETMVFGLETIGTTVDRNAITVRSSIAQSDMSLCG